MSESWLPSLNALRAFETVARHLNYNRAAEELRVTPAAVKQLVYRLETALDTKLIERRGRGLAVTRKGLAGLDDLASAMRHLDSSVEKIRSEQRQPRLILSVETSFATMWLVPKLDAFRVAHPHVSVLIDSTQEIADLHRGEVDVAIRYAITDNAERCYRLFDDVVFPACSPTLRNGSEPLRHLSDLKRVPLIHWDISRLSWANNTRAWFAWDTWFARLGVPSHQGDSTLHFNDYGQAVQAAVAGQGVVLASGPILRDVIDSGHLVKPFDEELHSEIGFDLVTTEKAERRPDVAAFIEWIRGVASTQRAAPENIVQR